MTIAAGWNTFSRWRGLQRYSGLKWAYRAPALFLSKFSEAGLGETRVFDIDERLSDTGLTSFLGGPDAPVLFYLCCHGELDANVYRVVLETSDWTPTVSAPRCRVLVCDTCHLVNLAASTWQCDLASSGVGREVRLLLGFASKATVSKSSAKRGSLFAEYLARGDAVSDAWIQAVHDSMQLIWSDGDTPIAIALGDSPAEAAAVLQADWAQLLAFGRCQTADCVDYVKG